MTRTVPIICAKRPVRSGCVPATWGYDMRDKEARRIWRCSFCGKRVKVVA